MRRLIIFPVAFALISTCFAQKAANIAGTWVATAATIKDFSGAKDIAITFLANGHFTMVGFHTNGEGNYKVTGTRVSFTLTKRNGVVPTNEHERGGTGTIADGGKTLLLESGMTRDGKKVMFAFVRKK